MCFILLTFLELYFYLPHIFYSLIILPLLIISNDQLYIHMYWCNYTSIFIKKISRHRISEINIIHNFKISIFLVNLQKCCTNSQSHSVCANAYFSTHLTVAFVKHLYFIYMLMLYIHKYCAYNALYSLY